MVKINVGSELKMWPQRVYRDCLGHASHVLENFTTSEKRAARSRPDLPSTTGQKGQAHLLKSREDLSGPPSRAEKAKLGRK